MKTPFTTGQFLGIFESYNNTVFPAQFFFILAGTVCLILLLKAKIYANLLTSIFHILLWAWTGIVYHILFFSEINKPAYIFGGLFILQSLFLAYESFISKRIIYEAPAGSKKIIPLILVLTGLFIYPMISFLMKGEAVLTITPGLPCPGIIISFGLLLFTEKRIPRYLFIIPCLWALLGISAAINFGIIQDFLLPVAALISILCLIRRRRITSEVLV